MRPVIAPFYRWPTDTQTWAAMIDTLGVGDVLVLNPASGDVQTAEGRGERDHWVAIRDRAHNNRNVFVVLYQPVDWGKTDPALIGSRVARAREWCDWDGLFFDEAPSSWRWQWRLPGSWLQRLHGLARNLYVDNSGVRRGLSIWNPGTTIDPRLARLPRSIWVTYEGAASDLRAPQRDVDPLRQAAVVYGAPSWAGMRGDGSYGYYYATTDTGPHGNPYDGDPAT